MANDTPVEPKSGTPCPHSDGKRTPICWDCAEQGHLADRIRQSPTSDRSRRIKNRLRLFGSGSTLVSGQSVAPEVHPPAEGMEVGSPDLRKIQPGLEVRLGPHTGAGAPDPITKRRRRRRKLWLIVICLVLAVIVGAAVGAGVGVTQKNKSVESQPATSPVSGGADQPKASATNTPAGDTNTTSTPGPTSSPVSSSTPSSVSSSVSSLTSSLTSSSASGLVPSQTPAATPSDGCLGTDGSTYTDPGTGAQFKIECDVAHQGRDIENPEAQSMEECVSLCANNSRCKGAIYYNVGPQGTDLNYCWLKSSMNDTDIRPTKDAQSIVRL
ncbi:hypothetical protein F5Y04DRAFT_282659 [Hypomontagnella monticulosa]|nr:hypothetical protein F5Y04DRAFT_282659 [Hypomontagnella monticulosa]